MGKRFHFAADLGLAFGLGDSGQAPQLVIAVRYLASSHGLRPFDDCAAEPTGVHGWVYHVHGARAWQTAFPQGDFGDAFVRAMSALPRKTHPQSIAFDLATGTEVSPQQSEA